MRTLLPRACAPFIAAIAACGSSPELIDATAPGPSSVVDQAAPRATADAPPSGDEAAPAPRFAPAGAGDEPRCPDDMAYVDTDFCPDMERRCLEVERERHNNLDICHVFASEQRCSSPERHLEFCIDRYEYPNRKGAHPVWMLDWYEAQATCESRGKRLCVASEWTAACEGPEHTPFPYGFARDHRACNFDNFFIEPSKPGPRAQFFFYSKDHAVALRELSRLDQSVPSGSMERCRSGFGVYDMTGNFDEWVVSDEPPREKSKWAGLKGGAWGHVRNQCRPMTYSHEPEFRYYFVGFRCCRDVPGLSYGAPAQYGSTNAGSDARAPIPPPLVEAHDFAPDPIVPVAPSGPSKTKFTWVSPAPAGANLASPAPAGARNLKRAE